MFWLPMFWTFEETSIYIYIYITLHQWCDILAFLVAIQTTISEKPFLTD